MGVRRTGLDTDLGASCDALEHAPDGIVITDPGGLILWANLRVEQATGRLRGQLVGQQVSALVPSRHRRELDRLIATTARQPAPGAALSVRGADGGEVEADVSVAAGPDGRRVVLVREAAERRNLERIVAASERHYRTIAEASGDMILRVGADARIVYSSPAARALLGAVPDDLVGRRITDLVPACEREALLSALDDAPGATQIVRHRVGREGDWTWVESSVHARIDQEDRVITCRDLTERLRAETLEDRWELVVEHAPIGMAVIGMDGGFQRVNRALALMLGVAEHQLLASDLPAVLHPEDAEVLRADLDQLAQGRARSVSCEHRLVGGGGRLLSGIVSAALVRSHDSAPAQIVVHVVDITERVRAETELAHLATHDDLTGLANRRHLAEELERQIRRGRNDGTMGALVLIDIDNFKQVNDTFGHAVGDQLLCRLAVLLRGHHRASDVIARLGGDEFALVLPDTSEALACQIAEDLRVRIAEETLDVGGERVGVSASVGVAMIGPDGGCSGPELMVDADSAMYAAKSRGRNQMALAERTPPTGAAESRSGIGPDALAGNMAFSRRLRRAVQEDDLVLFSQPVMDHAAGRIAFDELFVRIPDGRGGLVAPSEFLSRAERLGQIALIDRWVVHEALTAIGAGRGPVSVNLSGASIASVGFGDWLTDTVGRATRHPGHLIVEIAERALFESTHGPQLAAALRRSGCRLALDGFGSGVSDLARAQTVSIDIVKISGAALTHVPGDVFPAVVSLARVLWPSAELVATRVEHELALERVRTEGITLAQGIHLGAPGPVAELWHAADGAA